MRTKKREIQRISDYLDFSPEYPLFFSCNDAARTLGISYDKLHELHQTHELYRPRKRANGLSRGAYTKLQLIAMRDAILNLSDPESAYQSYLAGEERISTLLRNELIED